MRIKMLVIDVDGTLTDGRIYIGAEGEFMKVFDVKDGYTIEHMIPEMGVIPVIITGRRSKIVEKRSKELKLAELHHGVANKLSKLRELAEKLMVSPEQ